MGAPQKKATFLSSGDAEALEACGQQRPGLTRSYLSMQRYAACRLAQSSFAPRTKNAFLNTRRYSQPPKATNSNANGPTDAPWLVPDDSAPVPARPSWVLASSSLLRVVLVPGMLDMRA